MYVCVYIYICMCIYIHGILMFFVVPWFHPQMLPMTGLSKYPCNELMCSLCQAAPAHRWDLIIAPTNLSQAAGRRHIQSIHGLRPESVWARFPPTSIEDFVGNMRTTLNMGSYNQGITWAVGLWFLGGSLAGLGACWSWRTSVPKFLTPTEFSKLWIVMWPLHRCSQAQAAAKRAAAGEKECVCRQGLATEPAQNNLEMHKQTAGLRSQNWPSHVEHGHIKKKIYIYIHIHTTLVRHYTPFFFVVSWVCACQTAGMFERQGVLIHDPHSAKYWHHSVFWHELSWYRHPQVWYVVIGYT